MNEALDSIVGLFLSTLLLVLPLMFGPWLILVAAVWLAGPSVPFYSLAHAIGAAWAVGMAWSMLMNKMS
jgi:hypothetical protein